MLSKIVTAKMSGGKEAISNKQSSSSNLSSVLALFFLLIFTSVSMADHQAHQAGRGRPTQGERMRRFRGKRALSFRAKPEPKRSEALV